MQKCVVLQYDEMKLKSVLEFDNAEDEIVGPYNYMQILIEKLQKIYLLMEVINKLYISYTVVASVSDCGGGNAGLWKELNVGIDKSYFRHPNQQSNKYMFADAPHLLKLVRKWLIDTGFVLEDGSKITKTPLENLVKLTDSEVNICFKIGENHLSCEKTARQNVRRAAELLSHTTATALIHYEVGNQIEARALSEFIKAVNKWFDIFNTYIPINKIPTKSAYEQWVKTVFKPFMSINSSNMLFDDMNQTFSASYILTHRLNQDFQVRSGGGVYDHPSPLDILSRVRMIILGKNPGILESHTG
ncbi:hypothetical protein JTB14_007663 [Gonioctena quinquepunctata]|nr:hypothetical protein JTB14_007663 [Gonioctena quinquepunctata]